MATSPEPLTAPAAAVTRATPLATPVTTPVWATVAMAALVVLHETLAPVIVPPSAPATVAWSGEVRPAWSVSSGGETETVEATVPRVGLSLSPQDVAETTETLVPTTE